jgi:hypothetical protein
MAEALGLEAPLLVEQPTPEELLPSEEPDAVPPLTDEPRGSIH